MKPLVDETPEGTAIPALLTGWENWLATHRAEHTVSEYRDILHRFFGQPEIAAASLGEIEYAAVQAFCNQSHLKRSSRNVHVWSFRSFYKFATLAGAVKHDTSGLLNVATREMPVELLETKHHEPMTEEEYGRIVAAPTIAQEWRDFAVLSYCCGLRLVDCCLFEWGSLGESTILVFPMKTRGAGNRVALPITDPLVARPELLALVARVRAMTRGEGRHVWPEMARRYHEENRGSLPAEFARAARALGIAKTFHSLRTAFARRLEADGRDLWQIARAMGHSSTETTKIYLG